MVGSGIECGVEEYGKDFDAYRAIAAVFVFFV